MANPKRAKFNEFIQKLPKDQLGNEDLLSHDLAAKIGNLSDEMGDFLEKEKITIRLDARIIAEAKKESEVLGVGYQKILNDRLLAVYGIQEQVYLNHRLPESFVELIKDLEQQMEDRLEKKIDKMLEMKRA